MLVNFHKLDISRSGNIFFGYELRIWNMNLTWIGVQDFEHFSEPSEFLRLVY